MGVIKKIIPVLLFFGFLALVALFFKTYQDTRKANDYINFVTESANKIIADVESINNQLNSIQYSDSGTSVSELEAQLTNVRSDLDKIKTDKTGYKVPFQGEEIDTKFTNFIDDSEGLITSFDDIVGVIKNLEGKEAFDEKVGVYVGNADVIQGDANELESLMTTYINDYNKIDFNRVIDAIKSL